MAQKFSTNSTGFEHDGPNNQSSIFIFSLIYQIVEVFCVKAESKLDDNLSAFGLCSTIDTTRYRDTKVVVLTSKFDIVDMDYAMPLLHPTSRLGSSCKVSKYQVKDVRRSELNTVSMAQLL